VGGIIAGTPTNFYTCSAASFAITGAATAVSFTPTSCRERKQNIEDLTPTYCEWFVKKLKAKKYQYRKIFDASGHETTCPDIDVLTRYGFIAQEVKEDICGDEKLGVWEEATDTLPQRLSYNDMTAPMVSCIQTLFAQVEELKARLAKLESLRTVPQ
jgi:hypothetical protein